MSLDFIAFLNRPLSFGLDPIAVRLGITVMVAVAAWLWPIEMRRHWATWTRRIRRISAWMLSLLIVMGLLLVASAQRQDPIRISTWLIAVVFIGLNAAMLIRHADDHTTERQYAHWFKRRR